MPDILVVSFWVGWLVLDLILSVVWSFGVQRLASFSSDISVLLYPQVWQNVVSVESSSLIHQKSCP